MGLELHVQRVLANARLSNLNYQWYDGLLTNKQTAEIIMECLDKSGEFGPTRFNEITSRIEFGVHESFESATDDEVMEMAINATLHEATKMAIEKCPGILFGQAMVDGEMTVVEVVSVNNKTSHVKRANRGIPVGKPFKRHNKKHKVKIHGRNVIRHDWM